MEIVPVVDCAVPAENEPGGVCDSCRAAARTAVWGFDRFLLIHFGNSVLMSTVFLLVSPLSTVTTVALTNLGLLSCLPFVLSFALILAFLALGVFAFLAFCLHTQRRFPLELLPLSLNGLAAMTVSPLSNVPPSAS